jgi:hypothetical protein
VDEVRFNIPFMSLTGRGREEGRRTCASAAWRERFLKSGNGLCDSTGTFCAIGLPAAHHLPMFT